MTGEADGRTPYEGPAAPDLHDLHRAVLNLLEDLDEDRRRLALAEQEWRAAFDSVRDAMFTHDDTRRIVRANRAYLALARCSLEQAAGRPYWEVFPRGVDPALQCAADENGQEAEITVGAQVFRSRAYLVREEAGRIEFAVHVLEDITERRRTEQEIQNRSAQLAAANQALEKSLQDLHNARLGLVRAERLATIGTLASGLAHELNNPLMGVMNYVAYARERSRDPQTSDALEKAEQELGRMEGFVRNLLLFGRYTSEEPVPVHLEQAMDRALDLLAADLRRRGVRVQRQLPPLPRVAAVAGRLQQVFLNLFINAADAMATSREKRITITGEVAGDTVRVVVSDTGTGVAKEHEGSLFEPFFTTKPEGEGTGLGLSVSQRIMAGFGGSLEYLPRAGPGASFLLTLKVVRE
jgi:PAS domain S-box-containing protein